MNPASTKKSVLAGDPLWYKDAVIYEVHVRAFYDSDGDGAGDFRGLTQKLPYLRDLGITAVWVLPFCPSPWRDDGYDIANYTAVHPAYGTLNDFQQFLEEAHRLGLRVITELVLNHTSDQHAWFQRARRAPVGSRSRDFYVWSDTPERYPEARIIFKDFETSNWTFDPIAKQYFWHRFYSHQPDLNFDSPHVRRAVTKAMDFWLDLGVDGLRLDAVPYLFERDGTNCENLPETHAFLKELRAHIDKKYSGRMLLAEANQWPEDAVAYFGAGDECQMSFHFPVMPRLFMALRMEEYLPILDIMEQTPPIPDSCQWAMFLRNHDELTLEMVTDEERDYMYRVYAHDPQARINLGIRRRLAPLLGNQRRRIELMNAMLFSLPGTPVLYYGDEIGMGDNVYLGDRNGVRTPMQWSSDRNAGFSSSNPQRLYMPVIIDPEYHYESVNVESQQNSAGSLWWFMKNLIALRKQSQALSRGSIEFLRPENKRILAFIRQAGDERILVVANLSRFAQSVELDVCAFRGMVPVEMLGRSEFPPVGEALYPMTLGPHGYYWFSLETARAEEGMAATTDRQPVPTLEMADWQAALQGSLHPQFARLMSAVLRRRSWFQGANRTVRTMEIVESIDGISSDHHLLLVRIEFGEGDPDLYAVPLLRTQGERAAEIQRKQAVTILAQLRDHDGSEYLLSSGVSDPAFGRAMVESIRTRHHYRGQRGDLLCMPFGNVGGVDHLEEVVPTIAATGQHHTTLLFGEQYALKLYRRIDEGLNPEVELGRYLNPRLPQLKIAETAGYVEYRAKDGTSYTVGILHRYVPNQGSGWRYSTDSLSRYFEQALAQGDMGRQVPRLDAAPSCMLRSEPSALAGELMQGYLESARLMGQRTGELHIALSGDTSDPAMRPEPYTDFYRHGQFHGMVSLAARSVQLLRQRIRSLPAEAQEDARKVLDLVSEMRKRFRPIRDSRITAMRTRIHGDLHLGQMLYTGKDFVIIDLEGEARRPLGERKLKRTPLRDVASMLRSFHYAAALALFGQVPGVVQSTDASPVLEAWTRFWYVSAGTAFLRGYLPVARQGHFLPEAPEELATLLEAVLVERACQEVIRELEQRPAWARIPLQGLCHLLETSGPAASPFVV